MLVRNSIMLTAVFATVVAGAAGFDSAQWLERRAVADGAAKALAAMYSERCGRFDSPAAEVAIPVEAFPSGAIKTMLRSRRSQILDNGEYIWGEGVELEQFDESGATQLVVTAENCLVNRAKRCGWVEGEATASGRGSHLTGRRVYLDFGASLLRIYDGARLRSEGMSLDGRRRSEGEVTLAAGEATYDRASGVAQFEREVSLDDGSYRIDCDRAWVFLAGTNELRRVVALGNVRFSDGERRAGAPRVQYSKSAALLEMHGDGDRRAWLEESGGNRWRLEGAKIVYHTDTEQVEVVDSAITAESSGLSGGLKRGL